MHTGLMFRPRQSTLAASFAFAIVVVARALDSTESTAANIRAKAKKQPLI
jgi:hypothetical protein